MSHNVCRDNYHYLLSPVTSSFVHVVLILVHMQLLERLLLQKLIILSPSGEQPSE